MSERGWRAKPGELLDDRQREHFARYLHSRPIEAQFFFERWQARIDDPKTDTQTRELLVELKQKLENRIEQLDRASHSEYLKHLRRRHEILFRDNGEN